MLGAMLTLLAVRQIGRRRRALDGRNVAGGARLDEGPHDGGTERTGAAGDHDMAILERLHFYSSSKDSEWKQTSPRNQAPNWSSANAGRRRPAAASAPANRCRLTMNNSRNSSPMRGSLGAVAAVQAVVSDSTWSLRQ